MTEVCVPLSDELEKQLEEAGLNPTLIAKEAIISKLFERQLSKSKALQRSMFEVLVAKSKLTEKDARELSQKIKGGIWEEVKSQFPHS